MRRPIITIVILALIGTVSLRQRSAAEGPRAPKPTNEARELLKVATDGLASMRREADTGNVAMTPDFVARYGQWMRRVYDASAAVDPSAASRFKAAQDYLHSAEDMQKAIATIKAEAPLTMQRRELQYHVAAAKFEIARINGEAVRH